MLTAAHSHGSSKLDPSEEDCGVFKKLKDAGDILSIKLLAFLVFSGAQSRSLVHHHVGGE